MAVSENRRTFAADMKKIVFFSILTVLFTTVGALAIKGQERLPEQGERVLADSLVTEWEAEEEIDNFDFLYTGGETYNYDVILMDNLMDEAVSHIGTPYRYGSKGPRTFDCSGFTSYVYQQQKNQFIGASSRDQYAQNIPIRREELQRGDLVFFTSPRNRKGVGHVGIVVDVDSVSHTFTFIHASTKDGVKISKSTDGYYTRRYVGARRVKY